MLKHGIPLKSLADSFAGASESYQTIGYHGDSSCGHRGARLGLQFPLDSDGDKQRGADILVEAAGVNLTSST